jgi:hypothetical protein
LTTPPKYVLKHEISWVPHAARGPPTPPLRLRPDLLSSLFFLVAHPFCGQKIVRICHNVGASCGFKEPVLGCDVQDIIDMVNVTVLQLFLNFSEFFQGSYFGVNGSEFN